MPGNHTVRSKFIYADRIHAQEPGHIPSACLVSSSFLSFSFAQGTQARGLNTPCTLFLQDAPAVLFCCEDRAIICRECDLMIHTANEFTAKHSRHILFQVAAGLKALPPPGPGRPDSSSQIASDTASAATHMDKAGFSPLLSCCTHR